MCILAHSSMPQSIIEGRLQQQEFERLGCIANRKACCCSALGAGLQSGKGNPSLEMSHSTSFGIVNQHNQGNHPQVCAEAHFQVILISVKLTITMVTEVLKTLDIRQLWSLPFLGGSGKLAFPPICLLHAEYRATSKLSVSSTAAQPTVQV